MRKPSPETGRAIRIEEDADPRIARMRRIAWLLDRSFSIGGFRFGLDPIIGLVPGIGDTLGAGLSTIIIYNAARLGIPVHVLVRMLGNVLLELVVGTVPLIGDLFDFAWRANVRNLALLDKHYNPGRAARPVSRIAWGVVILMALIVALTFWLAVLIFIALWRAIDRVG